MKLLFKFKDGMVITQDITNWDIIENGGFFSLLKENREKNNPITFNNTETNETIERRFNELYSVEIVMD